MKKAAIALAVTLIMTLGACAEDVTTSNEYQILEQEVGALEQQVSEAQAALAESRTALAEAQATEEESAHESAEEIPAEVLALLDAFDEANERGDGSIVDLYMPSGYHLYGDQKIQRDDLAAHFGRAVGAEWLTEPYVVVTESNGRRFVVTRGLDTGIRSSAFTFEIMKSPEGGLKIAQTAWFYAH